MDHGLLLKDLHPDQILQASESDYPIAQTNPVTGYQTSLYRIGTNSDFVGWITILNGKEVAGYIYIQRPAMSPRLGSSRYVVMDIAPDLLDALLRILQSSEPLQIRFFQGTANAEASAFLEHRS